MLTPVQFVVQMTIHIGRKCHIGAAESLPLARAAYREFLADEGIEFGAYGYDWTESGARTLAEDYFLSNL